MFRKTLILTLLLVLFLAGCNPASTPAVPASVSTRVLATQITSPEASASAAIKLTDGLGRTVVLNKIAQRIVSLAPSITEDLFAVGAGNQVVGRDAFSDFPQEAKAVKDIGFTNEALNTELIVSLKPDLIIAAGINTAEQVKALEALGLTVYYMSNPATLEEMYADLQVIAQMTGHEAAAAALIQSLKARVAAIDQKIAPLSSRISVFYEIDGTDPAKPYTVGKGTFITALIERAGGSSIAAPIDGYPQLSLEQVVTADPAFIILGDSAFGVTPESIAARPGWQNLSAVKSGQVVAFDDNLLSRPGPRLVDGLEALAKLLRPELFK